MKRIFSTGYSNSALNTALLLLRVAAAVFMLTHGLPKLTNLMNGSSNFGDPLGLGKEISLILTVFAEVICSLLLLLGLVTRLALIPLIITMSVAAFFVHSSDAFGKKEMSLLYLAIYVALLFTGPGRYSLDAALGGKKRR